MCDPWPATAPFPRNVELRQVQWISPYYNRTGFLRLRGGACVAVAWKSPMSRRPTGVPRPLHATITGALNNNKQPSPGSDASGDSVAGLAKSLLRDVVAGLSATSTRTSATSTSLRAGVAPLPEDMRSPSYAIAAANTVVFLACALVPLLPAATVLLNHRQPQAWQVLTSCFAHPSLEGLMHCVFFTYVFGRVVERNHGMVATWAVYVTCGAAAAALAWWMLPAKAGLLSSAAPAAAWGLFLVGVALPRLAKKPLEVACLAPFALAATTTRYSPLATSLVHDGTPVGHLVHLAGASLAAGLASLVLGLVEGWQEETERRRREAQRQAEAASQEAAVNRMINAASQAAAQIGKKLI